MKVNIIRDITIKATARLQSDDILIFVGARQAGKTTILKQLQAHVESGGEKAYFLNLEDPDYLKILNESPKGLFKIFSFDLSKRCCVFVDEVQYLKNPTNFLKFLYDEHRASMKLLVSGSSAFYLDAKFKDSLAGRKKIFTVTTLTFREFLRFKNRDDLSRKDFHALSLHDKEDLAVFFREYAVFGGYPRVVLADLAEKEDILRELTYSYIKKDVYEANVRQDEVFFKLLKILSSQTGNLVNASELSKTLSVSKTSIDNYLRIMEKSFHVALVAPFYKNVRKELTKMPKVYFWDTGLRNFLSGNFSSMDIREDKGRLLENTAFRLLGDTYGYDTIRFWRTADQREIDFVLEGKNLAFEIKSMHKKTNLRAFTEHYPQIHTSILSMEEVWMTLG